MRRCQAMPSSSHEWEIFALGRRATPTLLISSRRQQKMVDNRFLGR
jgi:hypothetical protein